MASRKRRCLISEEILDLVFDNNEDDDCDDPEFTMDIESSDSDSDNDAEAWDSEEPLDASVPVAPPPSKAPRLDAWQWEDDDSADKVAKIPFAGTPHVKRTIQIAVGDSPTALSMFNALLGEDFWQMLACHTNAYALEKQASSPDPSWFSSTPGKSEKMPATAGMLCSEAVVIDLVGDCLGNGHTTYTDNWYSSRLLLLHIKEVGSNTVGTVRVH
ncbi:hypothetical protein HPB47_005511 [Ixodes persulcatus]|uniref:Uncharacterized protein n=1 Tax=Ixodes persulcatus TaxID=34615 RepID=A0AC60PD75_IXOPE|nr:hypothetical protein HPB47_005511 [Ixodes persulcatus]